MRRTPGDYGSLLCFLTTAYVLLLFKLIHERRPKPLAVIAMGLLVAAACLTKGVAGVMPGVGVFVYALVRGRWPRLVRTPWYALAGLIAMALVASFYLLRERAAPGYLAAVVSNELGGRYLRGMNGHIFGPDYYPEMVLQLFASGRRWRCSSPRRSCATSRRRSAGADQNRRLPDLLELCLDRADAGLQPEPDEDLLVHRADLPVPVDRAGHRLRQAARALPHRPGCPVQISHLLVAAAVVFMTAGAALYKFVQLPTLEDNPQGRYGRLFADLAGRGVRRIDTVDGGGRQRRQPRRLHAAAAVLHAGLAGRAASTSARTTRPKGLRSIPARCW